MGRLENLKAVVTGSGGPMGGAIAVRLAEEDADIVLNDRIAERADSYESEIRKLGRDVISVVGNVTKRQDAERVVQAGIDRWGKVDILVNVVGGIKGPIVRPLIEMTEDEWEVTFGLNLRGTFHCTRAVLPGMIDRRFGKIVNIASVSWAGEAVHAHYAAAKAAIVALTRSVATQLAPHNINVNALAPGRTRTSALIDDVPTLEHSISGLGPLGRMNEPRDIANAVLFLVSEESRNISGQLLTINSGGNPHL